jgi:hypothetical protein
MLIKMNMKFLLIFYAKSPKYLLLLELIVRRLPALDVEGGIGNALKVDCE